MKNSKSTKRALTASIVSLALCVTMLIGTTFAWFTDTASTNVNTIQAGTLKVDIVDADGKSLKDKELTWQKAAGGEGQEILWEPGCTYELQPFTVVNKGKLALKYKIQITGINGDAKLNEAIDWTITNNNPAEEQSIEAGNSSPVWTIKGHMKETAGNEYQGLSIDGIAITVVATQDTVEYDSTTKDYDQKAEYPVTNTAELAQALSVNNSVVALDKDLDPAQTIVATAKTTLNVGNNTIANTEDIWEKQTNGWSLISAQKKADLTINSGNFIAKENDCYAVDVQDGANVTIKDGKYVGNIHAVYVQKGALTVEGGFFKVQQKYPTEGKENEFVLNCLDENRVNGTATITVKGGTYVNFNPADCWAEGEHTNFVADGYKVTSETQADGDVWYTVVPE